MQRDQNVAGFEVAVDNSLLMGVLDSVADVNEQLQPPIRVQLFSIAVVGDRDTL